jgi:hypothetical protein
VFAASFPAAPGVSLQVSAVAMIVSNALCWHTLLAYFFLAPARADRLRAFTQHRQPRGIGFAWRHGCGTAGVDVSRS